LYSVEPSREEGATPSSTGINRVEEREALLLLYSVKPSKEDGAIPLLYSDKPSRGEGGSTPFLLGAAEWKGRGHPPLLLE